MAIDSLLNQFMLGPSTTNDRQVISLGAGTDTRYFRLRAKNTYPGLLYHEFDFPDICQAKINTVNNHQLLPDGLKANEENYFCHPLDLRTLPSKSTEDFKGIRTDVPTLLISECCLCYLKDEVASAVVGWFTERLKDVGIVLYEPIGADDAFGRRMVQNLEMQGIVMPTLQRYRTLEDQRARFKGWGFEEAKAVDTERIWETWVEEEERERVCMNLAV